MAQFPFIVESEKGVRYQLVKRGNFCELDFVEETAPLADDYTPARATEMEVEEVTLETRATRIRQLQSDVQRGIIEIGFELIAAKKEIGHGGWADWLQKEFAWTQRTANRFMRVAERFGKCDNVVEYENPDFDSSDSELNSTPTEEGVDDTADELGQAQINEDNSSLETSIFNADKEKFDDDLTAMRDEKRVGRYDSSVEICSCSSELKES